MIHKHYDRNKLRAGQATLAGLMLLTSCSLLAACGLPPRLVSQTATSAAQNTLEVRSLAPSLIPAVQVQPSPNPTVIKSSAIAAPSVTPSLEPSATPPATISMLPTDTLEITQWLASATLTLTQPVETATREQPAGTATRTQRPTRTPTATIRPRMPYADAYITRPGHLSRLSSPFSFESSVIPSPGGTVRVELLGEDGRLLMRNMLSYSNIQNYRLPLNMEVEFDIPGVAETARLQVVVENTHGEVVYISSVDVILLSIGEAERNPPGDTLEPFFLQQPWSQQAVQGGVMKINGYMRPLNSQPIIFELYTDDGELAASKQVTPQEVIDGKHYPFELDLPYTVSKATWARLTVRQAGSRIPGDAALNSVQVWLKP